MICAGLVSGAMDVLIHVFVGLHVVGIGALLGGFFSQLKAARAGEARMIPVMLHGALTMLVTGVALVGLNQADDNSVNTVKIGVKLALLVVILGLVYVKRDEEKVGSAAFGAVGALTTANIFIAVLWT
ncbi:membrane protein [Streptomyces rapamycinicus NRRL 5491]|uniref:Membrane protein n=2 Tax=Streptomyces rapamycinicus TaxID=1226757 RepID=A0A3L8RL86_STRRN|nr:membrane protein [Streptomyces rapamycinicus NRRL 5491]